MNTPQDLLNTSDAVLSQYRIGSKRLFLIGSFNKGVTIRSQQTRALNLVWALVHSRVVETCGTGQKKSIAIVGGGFAGLTAAAALLRKDVNADLTVFERCDAAIPLQHGSDTRWVHPHIYEWPAPGSESSSAALPVLNWTAGRASDVVVQVMQEWTSTVEYYGDEYGHVEGDHNLRFFCNTFDLQVEAIEPDRGFRLRCIADPRKPAQPSAPCSTEAERRVEVNEQFDIVILAVGFGLERGGKRLVSYWRNEQLGQPSLRSAPRMYIVSGAGDGAILDLLRLRISAFRQDRILAELFENQECLLAEFRKRESSYPETDRLAFFRDCWNAADGNLVAVSKALKGRLRNDTDVVWHTKPQDWQEIFKKKISFQNCLLIFLLKSINGFTWSVKPISSLRRTYNVPPSRVVKRYGTTPACAVKSVLSDKSLQEAVKIAIDDPLLLRQDESRHWEGGFFDFPGVSEPKAADDNIRARWRKEYLPGPTEAMSTTLCSTIAGFLANSHPDDYRLRVTLHRTLLLGREAVLQQCCEYQGTLLGSGPTASAARTFRANTGTIGVAYMTGKVVCTKSGVRAEELKKDMKAVHLNDTSRRMAEDVIAIVAIPMVCLFDGGQRVIGVLYADSCAPNFFQDETVVPMVEMVKGFMRTLANASSVTSGTLVNSEFWRHSLIDDDPLPSSVSVAELDSFNVGSIAEPKVSNVPYLNVDHSSFMRVIKL